ncbi:hypothetical protein QEN58_09790 [Halomonas alkaliantarctica]|uniref:Uncharacterized protein n=1 Tax=Halomonas alkaliantarctica TaxID=232346 RepID=A0ABY8LGQ8_9GAMM|nr:hypothetical protein [Halomonas alkaliantarctica]WGI23648.1 hypothetical protein QEN58_09790 [Halomonas alkaliantarctica]
MKIEFNLLGNAIDSIESAIELLAWRDEKDDAKRLKQAVLCIAHGVELLLKERLRLVHPSLVWENVDKYPGLSARTVTVDGALGRLQKIGGLDFQKEDRHLITSLRDTRNAIEHYSWSTTKSEAEKIVGNALGFAVHFARAELKHDFFGYHTRKDDTFEVLLEENFHFAKAFRDRYEQHPNAANTVKILCDFCHAQSADPSTGACELCGHWNSLPDDYDCPF